MTRMRVLITCIPLQRTIDEHRSEFDERGIDLVMPSVHGQQLSEAEMLAVVPSIDGIIAGDDEITRAVLERADRLRVVSKWGIGIDNIDLAAAAERGVSVTNTPGMFGDEVADVVIGYLVMLARQLHRIDRALRTGDWWKPEGVSLAERTIGIVGLGDIGLEVARRCMAMRMRVLGTEIRADHAAVAAGKGVEVADSATVFSTADVLSLNCPLTPETRHMVNEATLAAMKPGAWVINTARGGLIDEAALVAALASGQVGGAALDVFEEEPLPVESPLRTFHNVILGTHNSSNTADAVRRTSARAIQNLLDALMEPAA